MANLRSRRTVSRGNTPQSPARRVVQSSSASPQTRQQARSSSRDTTTTSRVGSRRPDQVLAAVPEQDDTAQLSSDNIYALPSSEEDEAVDSDEDDDVGLEDDSDIASEFERKNQLEELDRDLIIDSLPAIHQKSIKILSLFSPDSLPTILDEIKSDKTSVGKRFIQLRKGFNTDREPCGKEGFLDVDLIVRKLTESSDISDGQWRPDAILYMANLVVLVSSLSTDTEQGIYDTLEVLYNNFPKSSLLGLINDDEGVTERFGIEFVKATIDISISIRTQFFLLAAQRMIRQESFDPDGILRATFYDDDDGGGGIRGYEAYSGHRIMAKKVGDSCAARIEEIRQYFSSDITQPIDLDGLDKKYPWKDFVSSIILWATQRNLELVAHISRQGGVDAIAKRLISGANASSSSSDFRRVTEGQPLQIQRAANEQAAALSPVKTNKTQIEETPVKKILPRISMSKSKSKQINRLRELKASRVATEAVDIRDNATQLRLAGSNAPGPDKAVSGPSDAEKMLNPHAVLQNRPQLSNKQVISTNDDYDEAPMVDEEEDVEIEESRELTSPRTELRLGQNTAIPRARARRSELTPVPGTALVLAKEGAKKLIANKENLGGRLRYTDPQQSAVMERWDDTPRPHSPRKRSRIDTPDDEDNDEDDFELDIRRPKKSRRLEDAALPHRSGSAAVKKGINRGRIGSDAGSYSATDKFLPPQSAQPTRSRSPPTRGSQAGRSQLPPSSVPVGSQRRAPVSSSQDPPSSQVQQVNATAKINVRRFAVMEKTSQTRKKWQHDETNRLMELVADYGSAWARIKAEDEKHPHGPMLLARDQVALKDKARNIKMDFLKACQRLPDGFSAISIKNSDIAKLAELGMPYRERDEFDGSEG